MTDASLTERLLDRDVRALARAISLIENGDPAGAELVAEVYPRTGSRGSSGSPARPGSARAP